MLNLKRAVLVALPCLSIGIGLMQAAWGGEFRASDVESVVQNLYSQDETERKSAAYKISEMGAEAKTTIPRLTELVQSDPVMNVRGEAANALGKMGPVAAPAVPALIEFLKSPDGGYERTYAAQALGQIRQRPADVVPVLTEAVKSDAEPVVRQLSARALGEFYTDAQSAVPVLVEALKKGDKEMREAAADGLKQIPAAPKDVPMLTELLSDEIDIARGAAARSLAGAGSEAVGAVPKLIVLLTDSNVSVRAAACGTLARIGPEAKAAIPALKKAALDPETGEDAKAALENIRKKRAP
jgi:HEAT repeat protein